MRKLIVVLSVLAITWTSCTKEKPPVVLTQKQITHQVDSILTERNKELNAAGQKDLNSRLKIEVKVKADSILQARLNPPKAAAPAAKVPAQPFIHKQGPIK